MIEDKIILFERAYDGEYLFDLQEDIDNMYYSDKFNKLPEYEDGFQKGTFHVIVTWRADDDD